MSERNCYGPSTPQVPRQTRPSSSDVFRPISLSVSVSSCLHALYDRLRNRDGHKAKAGYLYNC